MRPTELGFKLSTIYLRPGFILLHSFIINFQESSMKENEIFVNETKSKGFIGLHVISAINVTFYLMTVISLVY